MPIYQYKCFQCGETREMLQKMSDPPLRSCPRCGGGFRKVVSNIGIIFKGSGFHITDYVRSSKNGGSSSEGRKKEPSSDGPKESSSGKDPCSETRAAA